MKTRHNKDREIERNKQKIKDESMESDKYRHNQISKKGSGHSNILHRVFLQLFIWLLLWICCILNDFEIIFCDMLTQLSGHTLENNLKTFGKRETEWDM